MPILWGSSRIFTGLIEAYLSFGDEKMLACARKLGDFYLHTEEELASSLRVEEYRATGTYAAGYATCYFPGMEGLVRLYEVTGEEKYLRQAQKMADFRQEYQFDRLPIEHTHGYLCCVYSLLLIYKESREKKWLVMAEKNWKDLVEGGYVMPGGGLLEKGIPGFNRDEGCSQADWLRVNLLFFELTGDAVYLDMAERVLHNQLKINQCETGGFGHRRVLYDEFGVAGYGTYDEEALWCCDFHGAMTLQNLKNMF
ncbi:MAG: beta-L-arabinofuranosidase domain-containing protein [Eisenbergiella sp.]